MPRERVGQPAGARDRGRRPRPGARRSPLSPTTTTQHVAERTREARPPIASAMPASGASSHSSPSAVVPFSTGNAEMPTTPIANETTTTAPIPAKRLRGSVRPGSRVSAERFATVSRPVYASIASGSANASSSHAGSVPRSTPRTRPSRRAARSRGRAGSTWATKATAATPTASSRAAAGARA